MLLLRHGILVYLIFVIVTFSNSKETGIFPDTLCLERDSYRGYCSRTAYSPMGVPYVDVSAGRHATCAIRRSNRDISTATPTTVSTTESDGVDCFGDVTSHPSRPRILGSPLLQVCVGEDHGCGITESGNLFCWGEGTASIVPTTLKNIKVSQVSCGDHHTCILKKDDNGSAQCFGENSLSVPDYKDFQSVYVSQEALSPAGLGYAVQQTKQFLFTSLAPGRRHTCGILHNSTVLCWGHENIVGWTNPSNEFNSLSSFGDLTCGIQSIDKKLQCFGVIPPQLALVNQITSLQKYKSLAVGGRHLCALLSDNSHNLPGRRGSGSSIKCWGSNVSGQSTPPIASNVRYIRIAVGLSHSCAVTNTFVLLCWGASEPVKGALMMSGKSTDGNTAGINLNTFL
jgi:hypothetical protein